MPCTAEIAKEEDSQVGGDHNDEGRQDRRQRESEEVAQWGVLTLHELLLKHVGLKGEYEGRDLHGGHDAASVDVEDAASSVLDF